MTNIESIDWKYFAEGNANIILSHNNSQTVIRINKKNTQRKPDSSVTCKQENLFSTRDKLDYINFVLKRLLKSSSYMSDVVLVPVSKSFLKYIDEKIINDRPAERKCKGIDIGVTDVLCMPHLAFISTLVGNDVTIAVELKPKRAFLCSTSCSEIKRQVCRFCMQQVTKLKTGKIKMMSSYCPLNLFSSCTCCLRSAFQSLLQCPQNNFIIFVNGNKVPVSFFDNQSNSNNSKICFTNTCQLIDILVAILIDDSKKNEEYDVDSIQTTANTIHSEVDSCVDSLVSCNSMNVDNLNYKKYNNEASNFKENSAPTPYKRCNGECMGKQALCETIGKGGILQLIKSLQMLDSLDIEGILPIYKKIARDHPGMVDMLSDFKSQLWKETVNYTNNGISAEKGTDYGIFEICKYLISSTFKDCGIIITFQRNPSANEKKDNNVYDTNTKWYFDYQIKLVDIDPRHAFNIPYYHQMDKEIVANFIK